MGTSIADLKIPDLWYDFYARLLPGTIFICCVRYFIFTNKAFLNEDNFLIINLGMGYIVGLIMQPIATKINYLLDTKDSKIRDIQHCLGINSNESSIIDKMHGEAVFYIQLSIFSMLYFLIKIIEFPDLHINNKLCPFYDGFLPLIFFALFLILALYKIEQRYKRAFYAIKRFTIAKNDKDFCKAKSEDHFCLPVQNTKKYLSGNISKNNHYSPYRFNKRIQNRNFKYSYFVKIFPSNRRKKL